ncbi:SDR family oxidoreductase [Chitinophaga japonensis]|uniref:NAD(P)-dependent dehydrogenase (Short-subunit alcohol dehydrogenase family) n=1 Tax=Chitinophaga japonensis TaxID=104662 RepID=A0A562T320_CHIJA|nr:SDR family oxidoreductase [Chitinophaga japonensis]TWI87997.1 NAD(P)-dependent dehydrogenase (short-subunit alcohol dehydrogenase family) [Chitinophaga japonensis]
MKVVIAGGTSGIGLATAAMLANDGASVIITGRSPWKLEQALSVLPSTAKGETVDAGDAVKMKDFMKSAGQIDHLVLAVSGAKGGGLFKELDLAQLWAGFEEKFFPQLQTLQAALPYLSRNGSVTFITAVSARAQAPGTSGLGAVNGALELMVPVLAKELQPLRVNAVSPGVIDTPWWNFLPEDTRQATFRQYADASPVARIGQPEDIAQAIALLVRNTFITGQVITVDGGLML